jgi:hypothetical protein
MATVTKKELVERLADQTGLKRQDVRRVVQGFLDEVINERTVVGGRYGAQSESEVDTERF